MGRNYNDIFWLIEYGTALCSDNVELLNVNIVYLYVALIKDKLQVRSLAKDFIRFLATATRRLLDWTECVTINEYVC